MKKALIFLLLAVLAATTLLGGCAGSSAPKVTLNVLNWGDYMDDSLISAFQREYDWIDINYITVTSNEDMYVMVSTEGSTVDLLFPSDYTVERMIKEDLLQPINYENIPNAQFLEEFEQSFDPGYVYSVPYTWGTLGILYNTTLVEEEPTSWNVLWDERYAGQIYMYNSMRDSIAAALLRLGYSVNTRSEDELSEAVEALKAQKPLVQSYGGDEMRDSMINGSGALCLTYSGDAVFSMMENEDLAYMVPEEGSNLFIDCMVIPKASKNAEAAELFINFLLDPENATLNAEYIGYSSPNTEVLDLIDEAYVQNNAYNPDREVIERCTIFNDLGEFTQAFAEAWQQVMWYKP